MKTKMTPNIGWKQIKPYKWSTKDPEEEYQNNYLGEHTNNRIEPTNEPYYLRIQKMREDKDLKYLYRF